MQKVEDLLPYSKSARYTGLRFGIGWSRYECVVARRRDALL